MILGAFPFFVEPRARSLAARVSWRLLVLILVLDSRYSVVVISNQSIKSAALTDWKKKIPLVAAAVRVTHIVS